MPRTIQGAVQFIIDNGIHYADGECERIVNNAGGFTHAYSLAILAAKASPVPLNPNYAAGYDGVIDYWSGAWGTFYGVFQDAGHTMFRYQGLNWGDSGAITGHYNNARFAGSVSRADLERKYPNLHYLGWTPYHGPETLAGVSTASTGGTTTINNTPPALKGFPAMQISETRDSVDTSKVVGYCLFTENGSYVFGIPVTVNGVTFQPGDILALFRRVIAAQRNGTEEPLVGSQQAVINAVLEQVDLTPPTPIVLSDAELAAIGTSVPKTDLTPILTAIQAGDAATLQAISQVAENTLATFGLKRI